MKLPIDGSSRRLFLATSAAALFASPSLPALADTAAPTYSLKVGSRQLRDAQSHKHADVPLLILRECLRNAWLVFPRVLLLTRNRASQVSHPAFV